MATKDERLEEAFPTGRLNEIQFDQVRALFEFVFDLENRVRTLESRPTITKAQARTAIKNKLHDIANDR